LIGSGKQCLYIGGGFVWDGWCMFSKDNERKTVCPSFKFCHTEKYERGFKK